MDDLHDPRGELPLNPLVGVEELAFAPDGSTLAYGRGNGEIGFVDLRGLTAGPASSAAAPRELTSARQVKAHLGAVTALAMTPAAVAVSGGDKGATHATAASSSLGEEEAHNDGSTRWPEWTVARWSSGGTQVYLGAVDGSLWQRDATTALLRRWEEPRSSSVRRLREKKSVP